MSTIRPRLNVEMSAAGKERIKTLMQASGAVTEAELIRLALLTFDQLLGVFQADGEVRLVRKDGSIERLHVTAGR